MFAGSGALGIEALSRDTEWVDFVEQAPKCCATIKENLKKLGFTNKSHVYCCSATKALNFLKDKYDIIFMDPPYSDQSINQTATQLANSGIIDNESLLIISHASRSPLPDSYNGLSLIKEKQYGDTCISIYQKHISEKGG